MKQASTVPDYPRGVTFEEVWASLKETRQLINEVSESQKQTDRQMKETDRQMKETDRQMKETDRRIKETERIVKENSKQIGGLHHSFGELAEHLVAPGIAKRFNELGFKFDSIADGNVKILDKKGEVITEIDLLLENGEYMIAVEVKSRPAAKDMEHHVKRLEILREFRRKKSDSRKILGAIAGAVFGKAEKEAAREEGFYVLEQSGDTMKMDVPKGFVPREW